MINFMRNSRIIEVEFKNILDDINYKLPIYHHLKLHEVQTSLAAKFAQLILPRSLRKHPDFSD